MITQTCCRHKTNSLAYTLAVSPEFAQFLPSLGYNKFANYFATLTRWLGACLMIQAAHRRVGLADVKRPVTLTTRWMKISKSQTLKMLTASVLMESENDRPGHHFVVFSICFFVRPSRLPSCDTRQIPKLSFDESCYHPGLGFWLEECLNWPNFVTFHL